jgi:hypothetical protein
MHRFGGETTVATVLLALVLVAVPNVKIVGPIVE